MNTTSTPTVYIVDDDADTRRLLQMQAEMMELRAEVFSCGEKFLAEFRAGSPGCLVLDLRMPGMGGISLIEKLRLGKVNIPILILSGADDVRSTIIAMKLGVVDFIQKPSTVEIMMVKIKEALACDVAQRQAEAKREAVGRRCSLLTHREREMLALLVQGNSTKQAAADMGISLKTAENHRAHVMAKTAAENIVSLVHMNNTFQRNQLVADGISTALPPATYV